MKYLMTLLACCLLAVFASTSVFAEDVDDAQAFKMSAETNLMYQQQLAQQRLAFKHVEELQAKKIAELKAKLAVATAGTTAVIRQTQQAVTQPYYGNNTEAPAPQADDSGMTPQQEQQERTETQQAAPAPTQYSDGDPLKLQSVYARPAPGAAPIQVVYQPQQYVPMAVQQQRRIYLHQLPPVRLMPAPAAVQRVVYTQPVQYQPAVINNRW